MPTSPSPPPSLQPQPSQLPASAVASPSALAAASSAGVAGIAPLSPNSASETTYSFGAVAKILDIGESKLRYWSQVGFVGPSVRSGGRQLFNFQDLISVKAAKELVDRGFTVAQIRRALERVRSSLPHIDRPLDRVRLAFDGESLLVVDDGNAFEVTGQKVFDFGLGDLANQASIMPVAVPSGGGSNNRNGPRIGTRIGTRIGSSANVAVAGDPYANGVSLPSGGSERGQQPHSAYDWFREGLRLDGDSARQADAESCYQKALAIDVGLSAAHTNLGQIAYRRSDVVAAKAAFEAALAIDPEQPEARFNLANLFLEAGDLELAVAELRRVLQTEPDFADAHYNLAVALERLGGRAQARAHLERYVRLESGTNAAWIAEARLRLDRLADA